MKQQVRMDSCNLLQVEVEPSPVFQRDGYDVVVPRTIDFTDAILGTNLRQGTALALEKSFGRVDLVTRALD